MLSIITYCLYVGRFQVPCVHVYRSWYWCDAFCIRAEVYMVSRNNVSRITENLIMIMHFRRASRQEIIFKKFTTVFNVNSVVQFYTWCNFDFPLFFSMLFYGYEYE